MDAAPEKSQKTQAYIREVFGQQDAHLAGLMNRATEAGLPDIAISADVGRLLTLLTSLSGADGRGAAHALEFGTLAGYSGVWIARGLRRGGRLITVEPNPEHAAFAEQTFKDAGVADRVSLRRAPALEVIPSIMGEWGPESVDFVFLDAIKTEYRDYFDGLLPLLRPGAIIAADNCLGGGSWWVTDDPGSSPDRDAVDAFNRYLAARDDFITTMVPLREGVLVARLRPKLRPE